MGKKVGDRGIKGRGCMGAWGEASHNYLTVGIMEML